MAIELVSKFLQAKCEKPTPKGVEWKHFFYFNIWLVYVNITFMNKKWYNKTMKIKGFDASLILSLMDTMVSLIVKVLIT